ncbi:MAG TPA: Sec-independent protein translocase protein TatB [Falsiroseomonas sp.]|jgi:sec-independent protein translocase protein TatB|nr:Sec-independent protein translocase protein TatB [Falsiroseomonas sp.]
MLGLDWTELALIAVVAVVIIGPKDLPEAVRGIAKGIQKLRAMAGQFQGQLDEVVREAKLEDVRNQINEIRNFDFRGAVEKEIDRDGDLRKTFTEDPIGNPLRDAWDKTPEHGASVTPPPASPGADGSAHGAPPTAGPAAPAFVPPGVAAAMPSPPVPMPAPAPTVTPEAPPAFMPPAAAPAAQPAPASAGEPPRGGPGAAA